LDALKKAGITGARPTGGANGQQGEVIPMQVVIQRAQALGIQGAIGPRASALPCRNPRAVGLRAVAGLARQAKPLLLMGRGDLR
jgi:hypothetical protein